MAEGAIYLFRQAVRNLLAALRQSTSTNLLRGVNYLCFDAFFRELLGYFVSEGENDRFSLTEDAAKSLATARGGRQA
jgi:hypothetical protein